MKCNMQISCPWRASCTMQSQLKINNGRDHSHPCHKYATSRSIIFQGQTTEEYITQNMPLFSHHPKFGFFIWLVIFMRDLFSLFSRVKSHSRKLKPWNFHCPCAKWVNRISIRPTSNCLAVLTPTEACLQVCLWRLSLKPSNVSTVSYRDPSWTLWERD